MTENKKIPYKIKNSPIDEAACEIRFTSIFPPEAVFGIFYQLISPHFIDSELNQLPILQLPEAVRSMDPNLTYQPHFRIQKNNLSISIGPRVIIFSNQKPYTGWNNFSNLIATTIKILLKANVFNKLERIGLRYINIFEDELLNFINLSINLIEQNLISESTSLRTELIDNDLITILQISNNVTIQTGGKQFNGSIIDIDCLVELDLSNEEFNSNFSLILETSHKKEKELFFKILRDEFIQKFEPEYEAS